MCVAITHQHIGCDQSDHTRIELVPCLEALLWQLGLASDDCGRFWTLHDYTSADCPRCNEQSAFSTDSSEEEWVNEEETGTSS
jgi:hypothetical protein